MEDYSVVKDIKQKKKLEKKGLITLHSQTGKTVYWNNQPGKAWYIDEAPYRFEFEGRTFGQQYFDGSFFPYLVEYIKKE